MRELDPDACLFPATLILPPGMWQSDAPHDLVALPLAATGQVTPWIAALGMALSSLLVTLNALRLTRMAH